MKKPRTLIMFASWEDRFPLGFTKDVQGSSIASVLVYFFSQFDSLTEANRKNVSRQCELRNIRYSDVQLGALCPAGNWRKILESLDSDVHEGEPVVVDISTMPREIIWYVLWMLERRSIATRYVYHSPESYAQTWLSRDPRAPRLVYKLSGLAYPGAKTALLVTAGFDYERTKRLIDWYEPGKLIVGVQSPSIFPQNDHVEQNYVGRLERESDVVIFQVDAFSEGRGIKEIREQLDTLDGSYNIVMSSLGPKLTSVTLYRLQRMREEIGLVYAPSREYNEEYSCGLGRSYEGSL